MTIQIDITKLQNNEDRPAVPVLLRPEHQFLEPKIGVVGVSFPSFPTFKRIMTTSIIAFGTMTVGSEPVNLAKPLDLKINLSLPAVQKRPKKSAWQNDTRSCERRCSNLDSLSSMTKNCGRKYENARVSRLGQKIDTNLR